MNTHSSTTFQPLEVTEALRRDLEAMGLTDEQVRAIVSPEPGPSDASSASSSP